MGDAGDLPDTAQRIDGDPAVALDSISGELVLDDDDSRDMYRICLTGGRSFSAAADSSFDSQLFLLDEEGRPVVANDDGPGEPIFGDAIISSGGLSPQDGGVYYLAISEFDFDPVNALGELIFPNDFSGQVGPDSGREGDPIAGWAESDDPTGGFGTGGPYTRSP